MNVYWVAPFLSIPLKKNSKPDNHFDNEFTTPLFQNNPQDNNIFGNEDYIGVAFEIRF